MAESKCPVIPQGETDLTEDQIQNLLLEAETRMGPFGSGSSEPVDIHTPAGQAKSQHSASR